MIKNLLKNLLLITSLGMISVCIFSCTTTKNVKYFQDIPDSGELKTVAKVEYQDPKIQIDDIITVIVQTVDPTAPTTINLGNIPTSGLAVPSGIGSAAAGLTQTQPISGYLVDKNGNILVPVLGKIHILGLTTLQARDTIQAKAAIYFKDPTVFVRFANFRISVTGEVQKPGQYIMPNEKVTILDALAVAGDLTIFGKRDNVLLIRENLDGTKTTYRFNLNKSNVMTSPYYYLHQNDIVYVEPGKGKAAANDASQARTYALIGSALTVVIVLVSRL